MRIIPTVATIIDAMRRVRPGQRPWLFERRPMSFSDENRATIAAYRQGRSHEQFLNDMWERRVAEYPTVETAKGNWPCLVYSTPDNVTSLKARGSRR